MAGIISGFLDHYSTQPYRKSIIDGFVSALAGLGPINNALDFGSGDGFFAHHIPQYVPVKQVTPVDVVVRPFNWVEPTLYDGNLLPFKDRSFELVYSIDVLHHCPDPLAALAEMARCTSRYLIIKDHNHQGALGRAALAIMDELGNRRFGIPSPYNYQQKWAWVVWLESQGFIRRAWKHPMPCHPAMAATLNKLQFLGLWERDDV